MTQPDWYEVLSRVNLNQLLSFLVVAEEKSFRMAAVRMHISQSALSVQVQHLERALGVPLFHRTTRSVDLTREGEVLASVARPVMADLREVAVALREEAKLQRGVVTVVAMPTFAYMLLPRLMCRYAELHPNVEIRLLDFDSAIALQLLQTGAADLAVLARTEDMGDLEFVPMFQDEFVVLIPLGSPMFNGRTVMPVEEVALERLVLSPKGAQTRALVEQIFSESNCQVQVCQECQRPQTLLALVENGFGITILPRTALEGINLSRLEVVRLQPQPIREVGIATMRNLSQSPAARSFKEFLASTRLVAANDKPS
ncbi:MAG: LysR family transcriptional regulator [Rhodoferax sp.]|nr:LysR family transcriptional regulator [Rhodoferax sp.]